MKVLQEGEEQRSLYVSPVGLRVSSFVVRYQGLHRSLELEDVHDLFDKEARQRQHCCHRCHWYTMPASIFQLVMEGRQVTSLCYMPSVVTTCERHKHCPAFCT